MIRTRSFRHAWPLLLLLILPPAAAPARAAAPKGGDPYLLTIDPVTGEALPPAAKVVIFDDAGRELRFASEANRKAFEAAPGPYRKAVDRKMIEDQLPLYPLETCPVSGEKLGGMGSLVDMVYRNRLVRFCCNNCVGDFRKNPGPILKKLDLAVIEKQTAGYPLTSCVVSKEPLGGMGGPIDMVIGNRLVRLCCDGCAEKLRRDPLTFLAAVAAARK